MDRELKLRRIIVVVASIMYGLLATAAAFAVVYCLVYLIIGFVVGGWAAVMAAIYLIPPFVAGLALFAIETVIYLKTLDTLDDYGIGLGVWNIIFLAIPTGILYLAYKNKCYLVR